MKNPAEKQITVKDMKKTPTGPITAAEHLRTYARYEVVGKLLRERGLYGTEFRIPFLFEGKGYDAVIPLAKIMESVVVRRHHR